jgi:peptidyl-prolyl cis-trans isomerase D
LLEEVKESIVARLKADKASTEVKAKADALLEKVAAGEAFDTVIAAASLELKAESALARRSYAVAPALVREAFKLPHPTAEFQPTKVVELGSGDAALIQLVAVNSVSLEQAVNEQQKQNLVMSQANKNYAALLEALKAKSEVKLTSVTTAQE